jgi:hypothetical protein
MGVPLPGNKPRGLYPVFDFAAIAIAIVAVLATAALAHDFRQGND